MLKQHNHNPPILLIITMILLVIAVFSCKKDKDEACEFPEELFRAILAQDWYVSGYSDGEHWHSGIGHTWDDVYEFDGDSTITIGIGDDPSQIFIDNPDLCSLPDIKNVGYWSITEQDSVFKIKKVSLCGDTSNFILQYENYRWRLGVPTDCYMMEVTADIEFINYGSVSPSSFILRKANYEGWEPISISFHFVYGIDDKYFRDIYLQPYKN
jgi:hypothetical protein